MLRLLVLVLAIIATAYTWSPPRFVTRKMLTAGMVSAALMGSGAVRADDAGIMDIATTPAPVVGRIVGTSTSTDEEDARKVRIMARERESGSATDGSYASSLSKEQNKQKALKKSKEERRKDLCEKLGRGC